MSHGIHWRPAPLLARVEAGSDQLQRGGVGSSVRALQRLLRAAGAQIAVDGYFGDDTFAKLRHYQQTHTLPALGIADASTLRALRVAPIASPVRTARVAAPFAATAPERVRQAQQILQENGAWPPTDGQVFVVQIDQDVPAPPTSAAERAAVTRYLTSYTGETSVFRARSDGRGGFALTELNPAPYASASHSGQRTTTGFTDFDGNGTNDIATLRSGVYQYLTRPSGERFNPTDSMSMRVARDLNQDGALSAREDQRTARATASGMQWHAGFESSPRSVGCQNIKASQFRSFMRTLAACGEEQFTYVLVRRPNPDAAGGLAV